jgi:polyribonucleotide nucleotidyltransferase
MPQTPIQTHHNIQQPQKSQPDHLITPYGAPSPQAYILPIPNECVGLIIGKGGDTIKLLQQKSGVKISVAKQVTPDTNQRNVFIEGSLQKYQLAKQMID